MAKFTIDNQAACQYKWAWSTIFLYSGTTASCHRCKHWDIDVDNFDNFHNHPGKIGDREKMSQGVWPGNGCEYCRDVELAGGVSERIAYVNNEDMLPPEMVNDPTALHVTPRLLEVYFSNLCNQACVYCSSRFSSVIQAEIDKWGPIRLGQNNRIINIKSSNQSQTEYKGFDQHPRYDEMLTKFWNWFEKNAQSLYVFQVLGGEPMFQPEFEQCIEFFEKNPCPNLEWRIFSNLKHPTWKLKKQMERIDTLIERGHLKGFQVVCSMDCWGAEAEYARMGMKLKNWKDNFEYLLWGKHVKLHIHATITALTLPSMWQLFNNIRAWRNIKGISYSWNTVVRPEWMDPYIFGDFLVPYVDKLIEYLPTEYGSDPGQQQYLEGIRNRMLSSKPDLKHLNMLVEYLDEIDRRRDTDWREVYPDLDKYFKELKLGTE